MPVPRGGFAATSTNQQPTAIVAPARPPQRGTQNPRVAPYPTTPADISPMQGMMSLRIPTSLSAPTNATRDAAKQKMLAIADRARQESTRKMHFPKLVENEKRRRRGGAMGDVVPLGKRKEREPDAPQSILRKPAPGLNKEDRPTARQRMYGPRTQVFNMDQAVAAY